MWVFLIFKSILNQTDELASVASDLFSSFILSCCFLLLFSSFRLRLILFQRHLATFKAEEEVLL